MKNQCENINANTLNEIIAGNAINLDLFKEWSCSDSSERDFVKGASKDAIEKLAILNKKYKDVLLDKQIKWIEELLTGFKQLIKKLDQIDVLEIEKF